MAVRRPSHAPTQLRVLENISLATSIGMDEACAPVCAAIRDPLPIRRPRRPNPIDQRGAGASIQVIDTDAAIQIVRPSLDQLIDRGVLGSLVATRVRVSPETFTR